MRLRHRAALALSGLLLGTGLAWPQVAAAGAARPAATAEIIGQFNMAGGNSEHGGTGDEAADALVRSVKDRRPAFMTLQETCADWVARLKSQLADYSVAFHPVQQRAGGPNSTCVHPSDFGNGVLVRNDLGFADPDHPDIHPLQSPPDFEQREMQCLRSPSRALAVCTAHLTVGNDGKHLRARRHEASVAQGILATEYAGYTHFLGGDLNDDPLSGATDNFYALGYGRGAHGEFKEVGSPCRNDIKPGFLIVAPWPVWT
ncbi:endonuclease/exonuclease/phosphatase family protein [Streptomyces sp. TLI_146]|uniref:endonuclease/exonuclease/phosphatase family protein n=1 Tax=Streptomyces sp. TLI_146 TaxID=1938858 RepID=UPI000C70719A|nr:endonuclease/exonuclease/phosphatase family protein [Streptomyces sp. TLI_146]PKV83053.1 hypothetical protein BX283_0543 [Streptomyces sp. TLI_146]